MNTDQLEAWWNTLTQGAKDQVVGGLIVAAVSAAIGVLLAIARLVVKVTRRKNAIDRANTKATILSARTSHVPKPPRRRHEYFVERRDENGKDIAATVRDQLAKENLVVLWGAGGVGKTTIAIEVANQMVPSLQDGIVWTSPESIAELDLSRFFDEICTQLGWLRDARPYRYENKSAAARMLLTQHKCLLVLDGFEMIHEQWQDQILAFLDTVNGPVLITSRKRLPRGDNFHLGKMHADESIRFLHSLVSQSPKLAGVRDAELARIAKSADYNPLAMRWVVRQLELGVETDRALADMSGKRTAAEQIFGRSFGLLDEDSKRVLWGLCQFSTSSSREAVAEGAGIDIQRANDAVKQLGSLDLVTFEAERVAVVNLVRRFAVIPREFEQLFNNRLLAHYLDKAQRANYFEDPRALDDEYENLVGLLDRLLSNESWREVLSLFEATGEFLTDRSGLEQRIKLANLVMTAARGVGDERAYRWHAVYTLAWIYLREGRLDEASPIIENSLAWAREHDSLDVQALCHRSLALVQQKQGNLNSAKALMEQSLEAWQKLGEKRWIAMSIAYLGDIAIRQEDYDTAIKLLMQSLDSFKQQSNVEGLGWTSELLGKAMFKSGNVTEARSTFLRAAEYRKQMRSPAGIAHTSLLLGELEESSGNFNIAKEHIAAARRIYHHLGAGVWLSECDDRIARLDSKLASRSVFTRIASKLRALMSR